MAANKRVSLADKMKAADDQAGKGADIFFPDPDKEISMGKDESITPEPDTGTETPPGIDEFPGTVPLPSSGTYVGTNPYTGTNPDMGTSTGTLLSELEKPDYTMIRHVVYLEPNDSEWVKELSKKKKKKESAIFRMAIKLLRQTMDNDKK